MKEIKAVSTAAAPAAIGPYSQAVRAGDVLAYFHTNDERAIPEAAERFVNALSICTDAPAARREVYAYVDANGMTEFDQ